MILITGSSGFVGTHLFEYLLKKGENVSGFNRSRGDIRNFEDLNRVEGNLEGIIHLAGVSRVKDGEENPRRCVETNVIGTLNTLELAKSRGSWFMYGGTVESEGNVYGITKKAGERLVKHYSKDIKTMNLRFSSVFGADNDNPNKLYPILVRKASKGEDITITNPDNMVDYIHIQDVVGSIGGLVDCIRKKDYEHKVIHLCSFKPIRILDLAKKVNKDYGNKSNIIIR